MGEEPALIREARHARRLGLFGGSFDPPHEGHRYVARAARRRLRLDHVLFIPAGRNPHKPERAIAGNGERVDMLEILLRGEEDCSIWTGELVREGPSFTVDTVEMIRAAVDEATELFLLIGSDNLRAFGKWHRVEDLLRLARPVIVTRPGEELDPARVEGLSAPAREQLAEGRLDVDPVEASSTELRARLGRGEDPGPALSSELAAYIRERGLYAPRS